MAPSRGSGTAWRRAACILGSVSLHALVLVAMVDLRWGASESTAPLRVALLGGRGAGTPRNGEPAAPGGEPAPARREARPEVAASAMKKRRAARAAEGKRKRAAPPPALVAERHPAPARGTADPPVATAATDGAPVAEAFGAGEGGGASNGLGSSAGEGKAPGWGGGGSDLRVACDYCPPPRYPRGALTRRSEGIVQIAFKLTADGHASEVEVRSSSGDRELDSAAMAVARRSRFRRAEREAEAVRGYLEYQFQLARRADRS